MNEFSEGDLVKITDRDEVATVRVGGSLWSRIKGDLAIWEMELVYTFEVIEKATPPLPTEAGWYRSSGLGSDKVDGLLHLGARGDWTWVGNMFAVNPDALTYKQARQHLPLTRLEPVADTAKKVAEEFVAQITTKHDGLRGNTYSIHAATLMEIANTFGVTS